MLETLSLGGGVLYIKPQFDTGSFEDLGFVTDFKLTVDIKQEFKDEYFTDAVGNIIRVPSTDGNVSGIMVAGDFECESVSRNRVQKLWFYGEDSDTGTELFGGSNIEPIVRALKFVSFPATGPAFCVNLPAVQLSISEGVPFINSDWLSLMFKFSVLYADNMRTAPTIRVQEEGESLPNFCS